MACSVDKKVVRVGDVSLDAKQAKEQSAADREAAGLAPPTPGDTAFRRKMAEIAALTEAERLVKGFETLRRGRLVNMAPLLPMLFSLKGEPYHLRDHYPFEPVFSTQLPKRLSLKAGRQVSKSSSLASQGVAMATTLPFFNTLYVTPLFEMVRRFSSNYVRGFIDESPVRSLLVDSSCNNNVLQRSFRNRSTLFFSYAMLDCTRTRGLNCDRCVYDEIQDLDPDFIPIINETMSGSKWGFEFSAGTPKTLDGPLEGHWQKSSQAEWHIWCNSCGYENIPALEFDLAAMTGPAVVHREVSERTPGLICAKCSKPLQPRTGRWVHHYPERRTMFAAYHIPQQIMPMHYANPVKWATLLGKRESTEEYVYYNEVCGESFDAGAKLLTQTEIRQACEDRPNSLEYAQAHIGDYVHRVVAVDWGGGGEDEISYTVAVCLGMLPDGKIDVVFAHRFRSMHNYAAESSGIIDAMRRFQAHGLVHDFGGAGALREHYLVTAGVPLRMIHPVAYVRSSVGQIMKHKPENDRTGQRDYYQVDKARSLVMSCELIRRKRIAFFRYDFQSHEQPGLLHDFLALTEDKISSRTGMDVYTVIRSATAGPDDFAQAVNICGCGLFYIAGQWPNLAAVANITLDAATIAELVPAEPNWDSL